jgi:hypothetical protein
MQPNQSKEVGIDMRYRTMLIVWIAIVWTMPLYLFLIVSTPVPAQPGKRTLMWILNCVSVLPVGVSFFVKDKLLARAFETRNPMLVQQAYVVALAICESAVLLGVLNHFLTGLSFYYLGMIVGAIGILLHFPRKTHLLAASGQQF